MAWLVGAWHGPELGGETDEVWLSPVGGAVPGMFRLVLDGAPAFYELWALREVEGSLVLDLKHFNPDVTGWEEREGKVSFPLVRVDADAVYFEGLTYRRAGPDTLQVWLALSEDDGSIREVDFTLRRRPLRP